MAPAAIEQAITPNTKAIILVHYGGHAWTWTESWTWRARVASR